MTLLHNYTRGQFFCTRATFFTGGGGGGGWEISFGEPRIVPDKGFWGGTKTKRGDRRGHLDSQRCLSRVLSRSLGPSLYAREGPAESCPPDTRMAAPHGPAVEAVSTVLPSQRALSHPLGPAHRQSTFLPPGKCGPTGVGAVGQARAGAVGRR